MRIDSHQHFWKFDPVRDSWIDESMKVIQKDFYPRDLQPVLSANGIDGCIAVQADQSLSENEFHLELASKHDFIKGIVGWIDLQADNISDQLESYQEHQKIKGFRHVLQGEKQRDFMLRPDFKRGIGALLKFGYTYDILIYPDQLEYTKQFVAAFPDQPFVIDHLAKPHIKDRKIDQWRDDIASVAAYENVYCKVSGMVTEAEWVGWKQSDFTPYMDAIVEAFGTNRLMFGSDWPVCLVAAGYDQVLGIINDYFKSFSKMEQDAIFGATAMRFYNL